MDYGIEHWVDDNELHIREACCATVVRYIKRTVNWHIKPLWFVELADDCESWQHVFTCDTEQEAEKAAWALATFIDGYAEKIDNDRKSVGENPD